MRFGIFSVKNNVLLLLLLIINVRERYGMYREEPVHKSKIYAVKKNNVVLKLGQKWWRRIHACRKHYVFFGACCNICLYSNTIEPQ